MKKLMILFAALALAAASGCSKKEEPLLSAKNPTTITLWHYYVGENQQAMEETVTRFNQTVGMENGILVDAVAKGSIAELEEAVTKSAQGTVNADPMPDIFSSYPDKALEIHELGMVTDLNDYFTDEEKALYIDDFLADGLFGGDGFLVVPIVKSTELFYVNGTEWEAFTADNGLNNDALSTWEEIYDAAGSYYEWSGGKALIGFDSLANYIIIGSRQLGVDVIDGESKQANLDEAALRRVFDIYYGGYSLGYFGAVAKFRSDDIKSGDLVAYVGSSSSAAYFPTWIEIDNNQQDISFTALPYPVFEGGKSYAIQQGAGMCVSKSTPAKQEAAAIFLKWFTDAEQNIPFSMTTGYLPVQKDAYTSDDFDAVLNDLRSGDQAQNNVAAVYEIALHQITESNTYAAKPFDGSYSVRSILQSSLIAAAESGRVSADDLRQQGLSDDEILTELDLDGKFSLWIDTVKNEFDNMEISYKQ